ncbi:MAG: undecaprenyl-diphosphate phosphatase [Lachnospiraceae bacterium]|nr:undecaprenyl-diphosphate phosphatase [Lachnospiraceae bacterium]
MRMLEFLKVILLGIVEGITEWLPISSTGHMILLDEFIKLDVSSEFWEMFKYVIQLGAILAVVVLYWHKIWPFKNDKSQSGFVERYVKMDKIMLWLKILVSCLPAIIVGLPLDDLIEEKLSGYMVVALMLILYGVLFIVIENYNKHRRPKVRRLSDITWSMAAVIGVFQLLAMIPGTSRSGATIIGGILIGLSRKIAAEYTFFLAIPVMFGVSFIKIIKFGLSFTAYEAAILIVGMIVAFVVSILAIKFLMGYIKKHDFKVFGWYRIALGILVLIYFVCKNIFLA